MLKGKVEILDGPYAIVDVSGVGYKVLIPSKQFTAVSIGDDVKLFTYMHVREDALELYGFFDLKDLKLFEQLVSVSGVGPKTAIGIFSIAKGNEIVNAITTGDVDFFSKVPRLGKKNAQKIIIELKNKLGSSVELDLSDSDKKDNTELSQALRSIGFSPDEIAGAIKALKGKGDSVEEKIKFALKYLGK